MFARDQYELLDFGEGRKLERFGRYIIDRPHHVQGQPKQLSADDWARADARYERTAGSSGVWQCPRQLDEDWLLGSDGLLFQLRLTESGQVGLFPEQQENWTWIRQQLADLPKPAKVLNLFAYTGGSTLAAAQAGAEVVHIDAAKNAVAWARQNAQRSGLAAAPIRWIAEDAMTFAARELRRGNRYDGIILDPPAYGHGPRGEPWHLDTHLDMLLDCLPALVCERGFILITSHSPLLKAETLRDQVGFIMISKRVTAGDMLLKSSTGRALWCGIFARCSHNARGVTRP